MQSSPLKQSDINPSSKELMLSLRSEILFGQPYINFDSNTNWFKNCSKSTNLGPIHCQVLRQLVKSRMTLQTLIESEFFLLANQKV